MQVGKPIAPAKGERPSAISAEELQLAARNHGTPLEALRYETTPVGLHFLLMHYDIPHVDLQSWRLRVTGQVRSPLSLTMAELRARPSVTRTVTFECAGNGRALLEPRPVSQPWLLEAVGTASWTGVPLHELLDEAGVDDDAVAVAFTGLDRGIEGGVERNYERGLPIAAVQKDVLLAYEINGQELPPQHGYPLRLVVPGWYGMANVKWLDRITLLKGDYEGYYNSHAYRFQNGVGDKGRPITRMDPRALLVPPGVPDFMSRARYLQAGPCQIEGRAWSGWGSVERVEVSTDGGITWQHALLGDPSSPVAWTPWSYFWEPEGTGEYRLCCRARDSRGNEQPSRMRWNLGGYSNNMVQSVTVVVGRAMTRGT